MTSLMPAISIHKAVSSREIESVRTLFVEYAQSLDFDLCFQDFETELATLPGAYSAPQGSLFLALDERERTAGCVGVRPLNDTEAEMKRLYVRPAFRGQSIGRILAENSVAFATQAGYRTLRLDTISDRMDQAEALYRRMGFVETEPYYDNPITGAAYYALPLTLEPQQEPGGRKI